MAWEEGACQVDIEVWVPSSASLGTTGRTWFHVLMLSVRQKYWPYLSHMHNTGVRWLAAPNRQHGIWERWLSPGRDPGSINTLFSNVIKLKKNPGYILESRVLHDSGYRVWLFLFCVLTILLLSNRNLSSLSFSKNNGLLSFRPMILIYCTYQLLYANTWKKY